MNRFATALTALALLSYGSAVAQASESSEDDVLLSGTIEAAEGLIFPSNDASVSYDEEAQVITVRFKTPDSYKVDYSNFWQRWRDNQWVTLQEFKKASLPVRQVVVITDYVDGSADVKAATSAQHVDQYAKNASDELWLRTTTMHQRSSGTDEWEKIE